MKVPLSWVNEFVNIENINVQDLIEKLTLAGFEVEDILTLTINNKLETILDISATANRPDSLSIRGISKEISAIFNKPVTLNSHLRPVEFLNKFKNINTLINDELLICDDFFVIKLEDFIFETTPEWLKYKLACCQIESEDNINDLINFILLETGYPCEFYDFDKIQKNITDFTFKTIDETCSIELENVQNSIQIPKNSNIIGLYANKELISVAGIGVLNSYKPTKETKNFLIECSIFNSKLIRQTARKIRVRTDRSARYEKGINNSELLFTISKLISLIKDINNETKISFQTKKFTPIERIRTIDLNLQNINDILGPISNSENILTYLSSDLIRQYLTRLNFEVVGERKVINMDSQSPDFKKRQIILEISIPLVRIDDITTEIDLIEEIGRLHGFNNFITKLPKIKKLGTADLSYKFRKKLTLCFLSSGINEIMNYSLVSQQSNTSIQLNNPLTNDYGNLRESLLPKIISNYSYNIKQGQENFEGFEYGHIFKFKSGKRYLETEVISGILGNDKQHLNWQMKPDYLSWSQAKGKLELIFKKLGIQTIWKSLDQEVYKTTLHPFKSASIFIKNTNSLIGVFGEIHPVLLKKENLNITSYLFELNFNTLRQSEISNNLPVYT